QVARDTVIVDATITDELFEHCRIEFEGAQLVPTGHALTVDRVYLSQAFDVRYDGVEYVSLNICECGEETSHFEGAIPLLLARYKNRQYEMIDVLGDRTTCATFDGVRDALVKRLVAMGQNDLR